jgi:Yip1 domain
MDEKLSFFPLFFQACIRPRKVVRTVLDRDPAYGVWAMVVPYIVLSGFSPIYYTALARHLPLPLALAAGAVFWGVIGVLFFLLLTWVFFRFGKLLGGKGAYREIWSAYGWSVPAPFLGVPFLLIGQIPGWTRVFAGTTDLSAVLAGPKPWWQTGGNILFSLMDLWGWVLIFINVAYVHQFRAWKSVVIFLFLVVPLIAGFGAGVKFLNAHF